MYARVDQMLRRYGMRQSDMSIALGMSKGVVGTWKARGGSDEAIWLISDTFFVSADWVKGNSEDMWRYDLKQAQETLREWARQTDLRYVSLNERFVAAWEELRKLIPMREDIWARVTFMFNYEATDEFDEENPPTLDWERCKSGDYVVGPVQIRGASEVTGLPEKWFRTGESQYLGRLTDDEVKRLEKFIRGEGAEVEDVMRAYNVLNKTGTYDERAKLYLLMLERGIDTNDVIRALDAVAAKR